MLNNNSNASSANAVVASIYEILRNRICLMEYAPGTKLSENTLAAEFGISRTPLRRALQQLEFEHLLARSQGSYTTVTEADPRMLRHIYEVRMVLAESLYRFIELPIPEDVISSLEALITKTEGLKKKKSIPLLGEIHKELEETIASVVTNTRAREFILQLYFEVGRIWLSFVPRMNWQEEVMLLTTEIRELVIELRRGDLRGLGFCRRNQAAMAYDRICRAIADGK